MVFKKIRLSKRRTKSDKFPKSMFPNRIPIKYLSFCGQRSTYEVLLTSRLGGCTRYWLCSAAAAAPSSSSWPFSLVRPPATSPGTPAPYGLASASSSRCHCPRCNLLLLRWHRLLRGLPDGGVGRCSCSSSSAHPAAAVVVAAAGGAGDGSGAGVAVVDVVAPCVRPPTAPFLLPLPSRPGTPRTWRPQSCAASSGSPGRRRRRCRAALPCRSDQQIWKERKSLRHVMLVDRSLYVHYKSIDLDELGDLGFL